MGPQDNEDTTFFLAWTEHAVFRKEKKRELIDKVKKETIYAFDHNRTIWMWQFCL